MATQATFKLFGREVNHPALRALVILMLIVFALVLIPLIPVLVPLHLVLRACRRNGFYFDRRIVVGPESFRRRLVYLRNGF